MQTILPAPVNRRSPEMWIHIYAALSGVSGKKILDVGAGYCDLAIFAAQAGARVVAIEGNPHIASVARERLASASALDRVTILEQDLEGYLRDCRTYYDVIFCTSVIPYLVDIPGALANMSRLASVTIVECQYSGDGPGLEYIHDDDGMQELLMRFWKNVRWVGETVLDIRPARRSIWRCDNE